jgi:hypothetical protein
MLRPLGCDTWDEPQRTDYAALPNTHGSSTYHARPARCKRGACSGVRPSTVRRLPEMKKYSVEGACSSAPSQDVSSLEARPSEITTFFPAPSGGSHALPRTRMAVGPQRSHTPPRQNGKNTATGLSGRPELSRPPAPRRDVHSAGLEVARRIRRRRAPRSRSSSSSGTHRVAWVMGASLFFLPAKCLPSQAPLNMSLPSEVRRQSCRGM